MSSNVAQNRQTDRQRVGSSMQRCKKNYTVITVGQSPLSNGNSSPLICSVQYRVVVPFASEMKTTPYLIIATVLVVLVDAAPYGKIKYDQRQEGKWNIRADLENFVVLILPKSPSIPPSVAGNVSSTKKKG